MKTPAVGKRSAVLLLAALLVLTGCGARPSAAPAQSAAPSAPAQSSAPAQTAPAQAVEPTQPAVPAQAVEPAQTEPDNAIHVNSVEQLLEAIAPGAEIVLEPGRYNLSEYVDDFRGLKIYDEWSDAHPCVLLESTFDGVEVIVSGADGLTLRGGTGSAADTEPLLNARYGTVLSFEDCERLSLSHLTMGHTDGGDCTGNVLGFRNCRQVELRDMDLYGCGVYGIDARDGSGDIMVYDSTIRDCELGPFQLQSCVGRIEFRDCALTGSGWGGYYTDTRHSALAFYRCTFGEMESNEWTFNDDVIKRDCVFSEVTQYPDYSEWEEPVPPDIETEAELLPADAEALEHTYWVGCALVDPQSGETRLLPYANPENGALEVALLWFDADGAGSLTDWNGTVDFTWTCDDGIACLQAEGRNIYVEFYRAAGEDGEEEELWGLMTLDNTLLWFH